MDLQVLLATLLCTNTLVILLLVVFAWSKRSSDAGLSITLVLLATAVYSAGYAAQIMTDDLPSMMFWIKVQYVGIVSLPGLWLLLCLKYVNRPMRSRILKIILWVIPAFFLVLVFMEHPSHYASLGMMDYGSLSLPVVSGGLAYWAFTIYLNLMIFAGGTLLITRIRFVARRFQGPGRLVFLGAAVTWLTYIAYICGLGPPGLDLTPFCLTITGAIWAIALVHQRLLEIRPIALDIVFDSIQDGVLVIDVDQRIIDFNPAATLFLPCLNKVSLGQDISITLSGYPQLATFIGDKDEMLHEFDHAHPTGNSHYQCSKYALSHNRKSRGYCIVLRDVTSDIQLRRQMELQATRDYLTGAYTRRFLSDISSRLIEQAMQSRQSVSLIMIDLDRFKQINDTHGHLMGDKLLQHTVSILMQFLPKTGLLVRYGGDEFVVLLPYTSVEQAYIIAERMCSALAENGLRTERETLLHTASFGVAELHSEDMSLSLLLELADQALYCAKQAGGNCVNLGCSQFETSQTK